MRAARLLSLTLILAVASCGGEATSPPRPALIVAVSANPVPGAQVTTTLPGTATFEVRSSSGEALAGVPVTVTVTSGGGTLAGAPTASAAGPTPIGTWTLGTVAGTQAVTVSADGLAPLAFTTTATPGPAVSLLILQGNNQVVQAGAVVPGPMRVRVRDAHGNGVPGETVLWTVGDGGGALAAGTSVSDAQGTATAPTWTLGASGDQELVATLGGSTVTFVALQTAYNIVIRYVGTPPDNAVQAAFETAVARISGIITGDLTDIPINNTNISCFAEVAPVTETVDDIVIYAKVEAIDGVGSVLGSAGPCYFRNSSLLPLSGAMRFDSADLQDLLAAGRLVNVITHEMLHVIGIGTFWDNHGLLANAGSATAAFTGPLARLACVNENGGATPCNTSVPVENCLDLPIGQNCGAGTQDSHWKESIFVSELMTGYLGTGTQPLSAMTIQSLADMGYVVNVSRADAYTVPTPGGLRALMEWAQPGIRMPAPTKPRVGVDDDGRVR